MATTLHLKIVTPLGETYNDQVDGVVLPGADGELGILPNHAALMTQLLPGELRVSKKGQTTYLAVGEGVAEVTGERVNVLTAVAIRPDAIDAAAVEEAIKRAQVSIESRTLVGEELEATQASLARSLAQLHVKRRRHL